MANQYQSDLSDQRKAALRVLRRGAATVAEIATELGLPRQTVQRWVDVAGLDVAGNRRAVVSLALARARPRSRVARGPGSRAPGKIKPL